MKKLFALFILFSPLSIAKSVEITVVAEHLPPYQMKVDTKVQGLAVDIVNELLTNTEHTASIDIYPWARAYSMASHQPNILILSLSRSTDREKAFKWIGQISSSQVYFWRLKSRPQITPRQLTDVENFTVGVQRSDHQHEFLLKKLKQHDNISVISTKAQAIKMLYAHRVELILGNPKTLPKRVKAVGLDPNLIEPILPAKEISASLNLAFSRQTSDQIVRQFQQAFKQLEHSGKLAELQQKWLVN